jgi:centrosomal protein CEP120
MPALFHRYQLTRLFGAALYCRPPAATPMADTPVSSGYASPNDGHDGAAEAQSQQDHRGDVAAAEEAEPLMDIRDTPEYAAAWDLELWRAVQTAKMQKELRAAERKALDEMKARVQQKEKAELAQVEKRMRDCAAREGSLAKATDALERRKAKVKEVEVELRRQLDETDEFRKRLDAECDARVARIKEEVSHKLELQHQRLVESQEHVKRAEDRAATAQKEYMKLYEEFSDFKTRMLSQSGPALAQQLDALRTQHESHLVVASERHDRRMLDMQRAHREVVDKLSAELAKARDVAASKREAAKSGSQAAQRLTEERDNARGECRRLAAALAQAENAVRELHARGSSPRGSDHHHNQHQRHLRPSDPNRTQESAHRAALKSSIARMTSDAGAFSAGGSGTPVSGRSGGGGDERRVEIRHAIERWQQEREALITESGGVYTEASPVVQDLDRRIRDASSVLASA